MKFWQVDAFAKELFKGNPAAVFVYDRELPDELMQKIAIEMNLSETAFILQRERQNPLLRWFTPAAEVDLCGHATLASAHTYLTYIQSDQQAVTFDTKFVGPLTVEKHNKKYVMNFPVRNGEKLDVDTIPKAMLDALGLPTPEEAFKARDLMLVYNDASLIRNMQPNFDALSAFEDWIIVTAPSEDERYDFISRFFSANDDLDEDPVTGSAHCTLAPYWGKRLNKTEMTAYQASSRGGELGLKLDNNDRLLISGDAITVFEADLKLDMS